MWPARFRRADFGLRKRLGGRASDACRDAVRAMCTKGSHNANGGRPRRTTGPASLGYTTLLSKRRSGSPALHNGPCVCTDFGSAWRCRFAFGEAA